MQFTEKHFVYDGINSRRYGLIFAHVNTEEIKNISGTPSYQKVFYDNINENHIINTKWDESPLQLDVEIISTKPILRKEKREIEKWLFNRKQYCKLYIDKREDEEIEIIEGEEKQCYVNCVFYSPEIIEHSGGIYGFKATMELSSPYALQDEIVKTVSSSGHSMLMATKFSLNIDTDDNEYVYPVVTFENKTGNTINEFMVEGFEGRDDISFVIYGDNTFFSPNHFSDVVNYINKDNCTVRADNKYNVGYIKKTDSNAGCLFHHWFDYFKIGNELNDGCYKLFWDYNETNCVSKCQNRISVYTDLNAVIHFGVKSSFYGEPEVIHPEITICALDDSDKEKGLILHWIVAPKNLLLQAFDNPSNVERCYSTDFWNSDFNKSGALANKGTINTCNPFNIFENSTIKSKFPEGTLGSITKIVVEDLSGNKYEFSDLSNLNEMTDVMTKFYNDNSAFKNFCIMCDTICFNPINSGTSAMQAIVNYNGGARTNPDKKLLTNFDWSTVRWSIAHEPSLLSDKTIVVNSKYGTILFQEDLDIDVDKMALLESWCRFPVFCNGENKIWVAGDSNVTIKYQQKRFLR